MVRNMLFLMLLSRIFFSFKNEQISESDTYFLLKLIKTRELLNIQLYDSTYFRRLIAETALQLSEFEQAEAAYVRCTDFAGIQLCKRLSNIQNAKLRDAEIASHFKNYDEAEKLYLDCDRR